MSSCSPTDPTALALLTAQLRRVLPAHPFRVLTFPPRVDVIYVVFDELIIATRFASGLAAHLTQCLPVETTAQLKCLVDDFFATKRCEKG